MTLFDDVEDDEFDGDLDLNDEEMPMIKTFITVKSATLQAQSPRLKPQAPKTSKPNTSQVSTRKTLVSGVDKGRVSPNLGVRRKTITTESGARKVVREPSPLPQEPEEDTQPQYSSRIKNKRQQKKKIDDVHGDFFGFGPNPPGCMKKDGKPVNFKVEKEKFVKLLKEEVKSYDLQSIQTDLNVQIDRYVNGIKKEEKNIMSEEERQLRNLDKLNYMEEYLQEDNLHTRHSLEKSQIIKEHAREFIKV